MSWDVEFTDEFEDWWVTLDLDDQSMIEATVERLEQLGPALGRPLVDTIKNSRHHNMKELRPLGTTIRILFAFDPRRSAILLLGGNKRGQWNGWYSENIPRADDLYDDYLDELKREGLL